MAHIPDGYHSVTPYLVVNNAAGLIDFLHRVFDAQDVERKTRPDGTIMHAEVRLGDSIIMISDAWEQYPAMPGMLYIYVGDVDATFRRAVDAGATVLREPSDEAYGDRAGGVQDGFGIQWWIATRSAATAEEPQAAQ